MYVVDLQYYSLASYSCSFKRTFSIATKISFNIGYHNIVKIKKHHIETGIDFLRHKQIFEFTGTKYTGKRSFTFSEIRFPATYNFYLFKKNNRSGLIGKLGFSYGIRINETIKDSDNLPEYSFKKNTLGLDFGLEVRPFKVNEKLDLGIFLDGIRTNKVYTDIYSKDENYGARFAVKFGVVFIIK